MILMRLIRRKSRICTAGRVPIVAPNGESPLVHIILYIITYFKEKT